MWNSSDRSNEAVPVSGREALAASATVAHWLAALDAGASGINLKDPADSGISLEDAQQWKHGGH